MAWLNLFLVGEKPTNNLSDSNYQRGPEYISTMPSIISRGEFCVWKYMRGREGKKGELNALGCSAVDETIFKISAHLGLATNLHSVKGNYYYPHFRNDDREADVLRG